MSALGHEFRGFEQLGLGMVVATSSGLIGRLLIGEIINDDDRYTLSKAKDFLRDLADGVKLVTTGATANPNAADCVRKLAYVVEPLSLAHKKMGLADLGPDLQRAADALERVVANTPGSNEHADLLMARNFLQTLQSTFLDLVNTGTRRTEEMEAMESAYRLACT